MSGWPAALADERRYLQRRIRALGVYSTDGHANFVYLPEQGRAWREVFDNAGLHVRHYANGGVRVTVGTAEENDAFLAAAEKSLP